MPFQKGVSGNPTGRPKGKQDNATESPVHTAWKELVKKKPWLLREAFERGLEGRKASVYLELGAKLGKEIGGDESDRQQIVIVMNSPLDAGALRPGAKVQVIEATKPIGELTEGDLELLEEAEIDNGSE